MSYLKTAEGGARRPAPDVLANAEEFPPLGGKPQTPTTPTQPAMTTPASAVPGPQLSNQPLVQPTSSQQVQAGVDPSSANNLGEYGLTGILHIIRMTDHDLNTLALGYDLTNLGLPLNSPEPVYPTLCCPWSDQQPVVQPEYRLPQCYTLQPPALRLKNFQSFQLETLFYIFYSMPRDVLQVAAAQELCNREWRFHKIDKCWFRRAEESPPTNKTPTYERGNYWVFNPDRWKKEKREDFVLVYDHLEEQSAIQSETTKEPHQAQQARPGPGPGPGPGPATAASAVMHVDPQQAAAAAHHLPQNHQTIPQQWRGN